MNVGELKRLIAGLPDSMPLLVPGPDHSYRPGRAETGTARDEGGGEWGEDYGEAVTPAAEYGPAKPVLIVRVGR